MNHCSATKTCELLMLSLLSNIFAFLFTGFLIWATTYAIIGDTAAPGGQLFSLVTLTVAANFGGWLVGLTTLPRLIGMLRKRKLTKTFYSIQNHMKFVYSYWDLNAKYRRR